jgi:hypothetical protein
LASDRETLPPSDDGNEIEQGIGCHDVEEMGCAGRARKPFGIPTSNAFGRRIILLSGNTGGADHHHCGIASMDPRASAPCSRALPHIRNWIFDLDNTLYPASANLFAMIDRKMGAYIRELLRLDLVEAHRIQKGYFHGHGTTLSG